MSEHTQGKLIRRADAGQWNVSTDECGMSCYESIQDEGGTILGFVVAHRPVFDQEPSTEANARRLVACWNACDLMPTEDVERLAEIGEGVMRLSVLADDNRAERDRLSAINAELIEALKGAICALDNGVWAMVPDSLMETQMRAAIAKAQGEQL